MSHSGSRRLRSWLSAAVLGATLVAPAMARAALDCQVGPAGEHCIAGLRFEVASKLAKLQRQSEWCWAASISMIFGYYGLDIDQEEIVRATWGQAVNMPGSPDAIAASLNRVWTDAHGRRWLVRSSTIMVDAATAAQALASDRPLIIGTIGHAMVLTALEYDRTPDGRGMVESAVVRDPWPGNGSRRPLSAQEWYGTTLLMQVEVTPLDGDSPPDSGPSHHGWSDGE